MSRIGQRVLEIIEHTDKTVDEIESTDLPIVGKEYGAGIKGTHIPAGS